MTLEELIRRFRVLARDIETPPLWSDEEITDWLNEAQAQACTRARLIREDENERVCRIELVPGRHTYRLHPSVYELIHLRVQPASGDARELCLLSRELLDKEHKGWRESDRPSWAAIQDDTTLRLVGKLAAGDVLWLECYRLPLRTMSDPMDSPEIHQAHHLHLIQWALHRAFAVVDAEVFDASRSALGLHEFEKYFGLPVDSDLRRITREDVVHHNRAVLP